MKKRAEELVPGDQISPPTHERGWMWRDGVKRAMTVESIAEGNSDARGRWLNVRARYGSPYLNPDGSSNLSTSVFRMRPDTIVRTR